MPPSLPAAAFENVTFWDARYSVDDEAFDWYEAPSIGITMAAIDRALSVSTAAASAATSTPTSTPSPVFSLLDIGCGTSLLAERIAEERSHLFNRIVACDASEVAIEKQRQRQEERRRRRAEEERGGEQPGNGSSSSTRAATIAAVSYEVADAFSLPYGDSSFDAVVDKGTADALDCGGCDDDEEGERGREREIDAREAGDGPPLSPSPSLSSPSSSHPPAARVIAEATRVIKPGGIFVMVSCRDPQRRRRDFATAARLHLAAVAASDRCLSAPSLFLSSIVGEISEGARDPCPNAHVYVGVKSIGEEAKREEGKGAEREEERAEELADAAARAASAAAAASAATTES